MSKVWLVNIDNRSLKAIMYETITQCAKAVNVKPRTLQDHMHIKNNYNKGYVQLPNSKDRYVVMSDNDYIENTLTKKLKSISFTYVRNGDRYKIGTGSSIEGIKIKLNTINSKDNKEIIFDTLKDFCVKNDVSYTKVYYHLFTSINREYTKDGKATCLVHVPIYNVVRITVM